MQSVGTLTAGDKKIRPFSAERGFFVGGDLGVSPPVEAGPRCTLIQLWH